MSNSDNENAVESGGEEAVATAKKTRRPRTGAGRPRKDREAEASPDVSSAESGAAPASQASNPAGASDAAAAEGREAAPAESGGPSDANAGGGHGHDYGGGGGYWKRNRRDKRKRGKFGDRGNWKGNQHPPQPRPPESAPVYGDLPDPARFPDFAAIEKLADDLETKKGSPLYLDEIYALSLADLTAFATGLGIVPDGAPSKRSLLTQIFQNATEKKREIRDRGWLDMTDRGGFGFVVHEHVNYRLYPEDAYLPEPLIRHYGLKRGMRLEVIVQAPQGNERCPSVLRIVSAMGMKPEAVAGITPFEELVPYYPLKRILLEAAGIHKDVSMRAVDLLTPVGFGQRGLIVAPPRTGKTVLLQNIANSISNNFPDTKLILLLIDERPEEVTDFRRHTKGEVVSSTFDESPESHIHCAEMVGEKARRLVEQGEHVVILLDSITRLARAYNALASNAGKIMSGGLEATALQKPKRFFGAARNIEGAGSLTILATALIDTGSRMDEIIFEEFKGTGNMELHLDRGLVERRIFPAINIDRSGTRKEELIYHPDEMQRVYGLRRAMQGIPSVEAMEMFLTRLKKTKTNAEFLMSLR
jgi:transcription termination factor Rho